MEEVISALGIDPGWITGNPEVISHPLVQRFSTPLHSHGATVAQTVVHATQL
jgi:hypothetical protein